ncbi:MAG TPA: ABC transporter permease [Gryllotalpicola sp.]
MTDTEIKTEPVTSSVWAAVDYRRKRPSLSAMLKLPGSWGIMVGGIITLIFIIVAVLAPVLAPHDPYKQTLQHRLLPPAWVRGGDPSYLLGTDALGRDILSRLIYGSQISLLVGVSAVVGAGVLGVVLGILSAYRGGWFDSIVQRITEFFQAFPFLLLGITVMAFLGQSVGNIIVVLILTRWVQFARVVRAQVLTLRHREYVEAAGTMGAGSLRTMVRHVLPNVLAPIIVIATFSLATAILGEASLSFLGVGVPPEVPTWGSMLSASQQYIYTDSWLSLWPGLVLFLLVIAVNLFGDGLRDLNDPKLRGRR